MESGSPGDWRAESWELLADGVIDRGLSSGYFVTRQNFQNFHLRFDYRYIRDTSPAQESGPVGRSASVLLFVEPPATASPSAIAISLTQTFGGRVKALGVAPTPEPDAAEMVGVPVAKPIGEWSSLDIRVFEGRVKVSIDGQKVSHADFLRPMIGAIGFSSGGRAVEWRRLRVKASPSFAPRVALVTHSAGYVHPVIPHAVAVMQRLADGAAIKLEHVPDVTVLSEGDVDRFDAFVFYTSGELPMIDAVRQRFLGQVRSGRGFVGIHSATDTFYGWPAYQQMLGGVFDGHPWHENVALLNRLPSAWPSNSLPGSLTVYDEIYQFRDLAPDNRVLLTVDETSIDPSLGRGGPYPSSWARRFGLGRVFYTALGHEAGTWDDATFQAFLVASIRWAAAPSL